MALRLKPARRQTRIRWVQPLDCSPLRQNPESLICGSLSSSKISNNKQGAELKALRLVRIQISVRVISLDNARDRSPVIARLTPRLQVDVRIVGDAAVLVELETLARARAEIA